MTWKELKEIIDAKLAAAGKDDSVQVWYIDVSHPAVSDDVCASVDKQLGLYVSN